MTNSLTMDQRMAEVKKVFEAPQWYLKGRAYHVRVRIDIVQEFLKNRKFERTLDIGCGDGSISLPLLPVTKRLTLLDMSDSMLAIARSHVPAGSTEAVETINGDCLGAKLEKNAYDLVICLGVFAYIEKPERLVEKLWSVLKPGGDLIVECSDKDHFISALIRTTDRLKKIAVKPKFRPDAHSAAQIVAKFNTAGFQLRGSYRYAAPTRISRKLFSQDFHYRKIRAIYGTAARNRASWLGNECIFHYRKPV
jgi:2-polyprenyl-3-methyl-5-hydroxy-6-metoxy-1,4-benzoquinol methylase